MPEGLYQAAIENPSKFEMVFEQVNPDEPSPVEIFSAQKTLDRLKTNLDQHGEVPEKFADLVASLGPQDVLRAMQLIENRSLGYTISMLYNEELGFLTKFEEQCEVANPEAQDPFEFLANQDELVAWLLLFTQSYQHNDQQLDAFQNLISANASAEYADFLEEYKKSNASPYAHVMQFAKEDQDQALASTINHQLHAQIESILDKQEDVVVVREAGMGEPILPFLERYDASVVVLVDPVFSEEYFQQQIEKDISNIDPLYAKEQRDDDTVLTFMYEDKRREVILKPITLDPESIKTVPVPDIYEMGNASVQGTRTQEYLSSLHDHMAKRGIVVDLFRHASDQVYREFSKEHDDAELKAFSTPVNKSSLYSMHSGAEPGYRIMLSFKKSQEV